MAQEQVCKKEEFEFFLDEELNIAFEENLERLEKEAELWELKKMAENGHGGF